MTGETAAASSEAAPRPLVFQGSVCTLSSDRCSHTVIRGNMAEQRRWGGWAWSPAPLASKSEENSENWRQGRNSCSRGRQWGAGWPVLHWGRVNLESLTSTRRPMLAMCGEQSLTVSSFSICRNTSFGQRKLQLQKAACHYQLTSTPAPSPVPPGVCPCMSPSSGGSVELLLQCHFSSTNDGSFGL